MAEIETVSSKIVYENKWMRVKEDQIKRQNGSNGIYGIIEKPDFVVIIPIENNSIYLVEQYRYPVKGRYWEFPQGSWENEKIEPIDLAKAELKEETGLIADEYIGIGNLFEAYGHSNQRFHLFIAKGLHKGNIELDEEEIGLISRKFSIDEFVEMIRKNEIKDSTTLAAYGLMRSMNIREFA
jgi:ADP-ribose pyrophosphatase